MNSTTKETEHCQHQLGPFPSDPNIRGLPCLKCKKLIGLYQDVTQCTLCGRSSLFSLACILCSQGIKENI